MTLSILWEYGHRDDIRMERTKRENRSGERLIGKAYWVQLIKFQGFVCRATAVGDVVNHCVIQAYTEDTV